MTEFNPTYYFYPYNDRSKPPIEVNLTGHIYPVGAHKEHPRHRVIEVIDVHGTLHDAFEEELTIIFKK